MRKYFYLVLLSLLLLGEGCQMYNTSASFLSQRYTNTVAYFNVYYNAQTAFNEGEKEVLDAQIQELGKPSSMISEVPLSATAKTKFNTAIEKASKLLSFYPTSKWVDDALMMIGKSYYYLGDDLKAERKFLEMFAKYPDSDLRFEAELWYGRSLIRQKRYDEGVQALERLYTDAVEKNEKQIAGLASLSIGKYFYSIQDYERAVTNFQRSLETSTDGKLNAETQLQIGFCYVALDDLEKASAAFTRVEDFDPEYATSFAARFENIKILAGKHQFEDALRQLENFLSNAKNLENVPKIHFEIGRIYLSQNRINEAISKFMYVDTAFAKTDVAAKAYYTLGKIFETIQIDYVKARINYGKAKLEYPASLITADATKKADGFVKYFLLYSDLSRCDSLITSIQARKIKRDSMALAADTLHPADSALVLSSTVKSLTQSKEGSQKLSVVKDSLARVDSLKRESDARLLASEKYSVDTLRQAIVRDHFELAGVFYLEIERQDSALFWFQKVIDEGGETEYAPRALFTIAEIYKTSGTKEKGNADSVYSAVISRYPQSQYAQESRRILGIPPLEARQDTAEELYLHAETYLDGANADSALPFLYKIVQENRLSPYSPKALYAIGWVYENKLEEEDSASAVYRRLIAAYPSSKFALAVKPKVQEEDNERKEAARKAADDIAQKKKKEADEKNTEKGSKEEKPKPLINKEQQ